MISQGGNTQSDYTSSRGEVDAAREDFLKTLEELVPYESFQYDAETKTYKSTKTIELSKVGLSSEDVTLTFTEGKLTDVLYFVNFPMSSTSVMTIESHIVISDYGTTTVAN